MHSVESFHDLPQPRCHKRKRKRGLHFLFHDLDDRVVVACKKIVRSATFSRVRCDQILVFLE